MPYSRELKKLKRTIDSERKKAYRARALGIALVTVVASSILAFWQWRLALLKSTARTELAAQIDTIVDDAQRAVNNLESMLIGLRGFYISSKEVSQEEFARYTAELKASPEIPPFFALQFIGRELGRDGEDRYQVANVYPKALERLQIGTSPSEPALLESLTVARDTGEMIATHGIRFPKAKSEVADGTVLIAPVYRGGGIPDTIEARRERLLGFATALFYPRSFFNVAAERASAIGLHEIILEFDAHGRTIQSSLVRFPHTEAGQIETFVSELTIGMQSFLITAYGLSRIDAGFLRLGPNAYSLIISFLVVLLVAARCWTEARSRLRLFDLIDSLTAEAELGGELLHSIIDNVPVMLFLKHPEDLRLVVWNRAAEQLTGVPRSAILNKTGLESFPEEQMEDFFQVDRQVLATGQLLEREEVIDTPHRGRRQLVTKKIPIADAGGRWRYLLGVSEDITEKRRLEAEMALSQKLEAVGRLAAGVAHEINNPLQYTMTNLYFVKDALGALETLARADQQIEQKRRRIESAVSDAIEGSERMARIVGGMKELSHPGGQTKSMASLQKLIENCISVSRHEWRYVAEVSTSFDDQLDAVPVFASELMQSLINLIVNAAQAIEECGRKGGLISIATKREGSYATITVRDNGAGIRPEHMSRIYEPFFTTKEPGKGTGQGLPLVHATVSRHAGTISVVSERGCGTEFKIRLPLIEESHHEIHVA